MKKIILIVLLLSFKISHAQTIYDDVSTKTMIFENFNDGMVYMKNGNSGTAKVNYDADKQRIIFIQGDKYQELTGLETIDSIVINNKTFIPFKGKIIEKTGNKDLYITYAFVTNPLETTTDHGGSRKEDQSVVSNTVSTVYTTGRFEKTWKYRFYPVFWILKNDELVDIGNTKQLAKAYRTDKEYIHSFISSNQLDVHKESDVLAILGMLSKTKK